MNTSSSAYSRNTVHIETGKSMLYKFDMSGQIEYTNSYYLDFSEYSIEEIIGKTALEIKHPEFPTTVFNHIMQHLYQKKKIHVLSKDQTKSGKYYWFVTNFHFKTDTNGEILSFYSYRLPAPMSIPKEITDLYDKLLKMEQYAGLKVAQNYFEGFLEEIDLILICLLEI